MPTGGALGAPWRFHESMLNLPVIHRLGIETVPVDESSKKSEGRESRDGVEPVPISALGLRSLLSTRLFD